MGSATFIVLLLSIFTVNIINTSNPVLPIIGTEDNTSLSCSDFTPKKDFDIRKFLGSWKIIETHTENGDAVVNCMGVVISHAPINGTYLTKIFLHSAGKRKSLLQQYIKTTHEPGHLDVLTGSLEANQDDTVLEATGQTIYDTALLLTCRDTNFDGITDLIEIDFLSRGIKITDDVYNNYVDILENYGITAELVQAEQEECF